MTAIAELLVGDDPERWRAIGLAVEPDATCRIGTVRLRFGEEAGRGLIGWTLAGAPDESVATVDGVPTAHGEASSAAPVEHPVGVRVIDHVVLLTPDVGRTVRAVELSLGVPLRRTRDGEANGRPVRQAFFRLGEVILEVVGPPEGDASGGPARLFGIALTVGSLADAAALLGPRLGEAKPAVQEGRSIATVRSSAGLSVAVALMSPAV